MEKAIGLKVVLVSNGSSGALKDLDKGAVNAASGDPQACVPARSFPWRKPI
jgi:hypothetical protein